MRPVRKAIILAACCVALWMPLRGSAEEKKPVEISVTSEDSIIHIGSLDSFDITEGGVRAAKWLLQALETQDRSQSSAAARNAIALYRQLIPNENFGGEYTALEWFCEYLLASTADQKHFFKDPLEKAYFDYLAHDGFAVLREYIKEKYKLVEFKPEDSTVGRTHRSSLEDFILFDNPKRNSWENSEKLLRALPFRSGSTIVDIGSGPGYFTYRFSKTVGEYGHVYALDTKQQHLDFIDTFVRDQRIKNITTIHSTTKDLCLNGRKVDYAFMCSLYHILYGVSSDREREGMIRSIRNALKPGGEFIVVDNGPVANDVAPYHGPYIDKQLIIAQLEQYGFRLVKYVQIIPQRYLLRFVVDELDER